MVAGVLNHGQCGDTDDPHNGSLLNGDHGHEQGLGVANHIRHRVTGVLSSLAILSACSGGGSGSGTTAFVGPPISTITPAPSPSPTPTPASLCSLRARQDWAFAQLREWYLFPETLPASLDPTPFATVESYVDALTATARAQNRDRFFTFLTTISGENAFINSGASAGFGIRLAFDSSSRLFVAEAFEGAPALAAGIDRGTQIVAIGTSSSDLQTVASLVASGGGNAVTNALGPNTVGTARALQITDSAGTRIVTVAKTEFSLSPVSTRYGAQIITDGGRRVGYLNLRTFISTANDQLRNAFASFRAQGITNIILDFRYNGGGIVPTAELLGDLLGNARSTSEVFSFTTFRPEKSANNTTRAFATAPQSIAPMKIAVIGTGSTASASELVTNAMIPYLRANVGLIGSNTFGKPVGQIALDQPACDDRLRVVAFATQNANRQANYFNGLAGAVQASCQAADDLTRPLGDPQEASTRAALNYLAGQSCTPIAAAVASGEQRPSSLRGPGQRLLSPEQPNPMQRDVPGAF